MDSEVPPNGGSDAGGAEAETMEGISPMHDSLVWKNSSKFFPPKDEPELQMPTPALRTTSHESDRPAIISTASSQERLESLLLPDYSDISQERSVNRSEWRIHAQPRMEGVCEAILQDNMYKVSNFLTENTNFKNRGVAFPAKIESRAENLISSRSLTLGHLLTLFSSPATLQFLETKQQLTPAMFKARCDLEVEYLSVDITIGRQTSSSSSMRESFRSVPCSFMATLRDNNAALVWLWHKRYLRRNANEVDSSGRNLLHCCVDEESPLILQEVLTNRKLITRDILHDMLKTRDAVSEETPLIRACSKVDPVMMMLFIQVCPYEFVTEDEDLSGVGKSVFNILFTKVVDSTIAIQVAKEFLKRGASPDRHTLDDMPCIEALIANEHFSGPELKQAVKLLLKYNAKSSSGALLKLLRMRFRTDEDLLDITRILIKNGGTRVLMSAQAFNLWRNNRGGSQKQAQQNQTAARDGQSVVVAIIKNKRISMTTMERLFNYISRYADIKAMFPDADGIALAISERMAYDPHQEQHLDLEGILRLLLQYACANRQDNDVRDFFDRLLRGLLRCIFERSDFSKAEKPYDKVLGYITHCLNTMEKMKLNFNTVVDGQVGLFSLFHANVPDEVVIGTIESLPKSFNINIQSGLSENLATLTIKRFGNDFDTIYRVFLQLKEMGFDFKETVYKSETLLMVYVRKCGEMFDQLEEQDKLTAYIEEDFFKVMRFLFDEKVDMTHQAKADEGQDKGIITRINVLTAAMRLKHCTIAEEIMKINPKLLNYVDVESVLIFIRNCPEVLEFLNGRSLLMRSESLHGGVNSKQQDKGDDDVLQCRLQQDDHLDVGNCITNVRSVWLNYVQHQHQKLLSYIGDESEEEDYTKQIELIYDYLVHCEMDDEEDPEAPPSKFALEFSVFRRPELDLMPRTPEQAKEERINAPLFLKIVEKCSNVEQHPLFTEYFEKYYRSAFLNSLLFILYHILFIIFLNGSISHVITESTHYALSSPLAMARHYRCFMTNCTIEALPPGQRIMVIYERGRENACPDDEKCPRCLVHTANKSLCDEPAKANTTLCPFKGHLHDPWMVPIQYFLLVMASVGLLREIIQLLMDPRDYMKNYIQNFVEIVMYLFVILFSINVTPCPDRAGFKMNWQFRLGVFAVLNSWFMMFFYTSKFPAFATYVIMFYSAVTSGLWLLITFSSLFFGFGFVFHLLLGNQLMFRSILTSLNKVWIMMAGEIDYKDTMTSQFEGGDDSTKVNYEFVTRFMLILFVLVISIVLTNLFIGLIVGDVEKINRIAETKKWKLNLEFIEYTDALADFFRKWAERFRRCCGGRREPVQRLPSNDPCAEERRCTQYLMENRQNSLMGDFEKAGLYAADLSWRNMFRWHVDLKRTQFAKEKWIAEFFGFVPRQELMKRLMALEIRKRRLRAKYDSRRSRDRLHNTVIHVDIPADPDDVEGEIIQKMVLPALAAAPRTDTDLSDPESEVTCHDLSLMRLKKLSKPLDYTEVTADMGSSLGAESPTEAPVFGRFLPRHDRKGQRRLLRPFSADALNGDQLVGVGVQPPRHFFPSNAASPRSRSFTKPRRV